MAAEHTSIYPTFGDDDVAGASNNGGDDVSVS